MSGRPCPNWWAGCAGRVAVTCFASNVARVESVALAARDAGRTVAVVGRSLRNLDAAARECGYLRGIPSFATEDEANDISDDNLLILVTGSQGEPRSALARIAAGYASADRTGRGRQRRVQQPRHSGQRTRGRRGAGQSFPARREPDRGPRSGDPRLRPPGARRVAPPLHPGASPLYRAGAWRMAAHGRPCRTGPRDGGHADHHGGWRHPQHGARRARDRGQRPGSCHMALF